MSNIKLLYLNDVHMRVLTDDQSTLVDLSNLFKFYVPGYKFMPKYKEKIWDGQIRLLNRRDGTLYIGLIEYIREFAKNYEHTLEIDKRLLKETIIEKKDIVKFVEGLDIRNESGEIITPWQHQWLMVYLALTKKRCTIVSATSSGKTLSTYLITRFLQKSGSKPILLVVPRVDLVEQTYDDFDVYAQTDKNWFSKNEIHKIYSGQSKVSEKFCTVSTWQSIYKEKKAYFNRFQAILIDECFKKGTLILTPFGYKKIELLNVGDTIINYDEKSKKFKEDFIVETYTNKPKTQKYELEFDTGEKIEVTGNHKFLTDVGWIRADKISEKHDIININRGFQILEAK